MSTEIPPEDFLEIHQKNFFMHFCITFFWNVLCSTFGYIPRTPCGTPLDISSVSSPEDPSKILQWFISGISSGFSSRFLLEFLQVFFSQIPSGSPEDDSSRKRLSSKILSGIVSGFSPDISFGISLQKVPVLNLQSVPSGVPERCSRNFFYTRRSAWNSFNSSF